MFSRVSRHFFSTYTKPRWLFVGLGNAGDKYKGIRQNVGYEVIDAFAESQGITMDEVFFKASFGQGLVCNVPVLLAKPQTGMDLSGESIIQLVLHFKVPLVHFILVHDDTSLPCGILRFTLKESVENHKGAKSVTKHFQGNGVYARLRVGIGKPPPSIKSKAYLLEPFCATGRERMDVAVEEGVAGLSEVLSMGIKKGANAFNTQQLFKRYRMRPMPSVSHHPHVGGRK